MARATAGHALDGIADLKDGSTADQCNDALKNRAFWSVLANPRFDDLFNLKLHKNGKYLDTVLAKVKEGNLRFQLDGEGGATVVCEHGEYGSCGVKLLRAIVGEPGTDGAAGREKLPKVHPWIKWHDLDPSQREIGDPIDRPAVLDGIALALIDEGAFSDANILAKIREFFIKLQRQARSELEPRKAGVAGSPTASNLGALAGSQWTDHCDSVEHALESGPWIVANEDGKYMPGETIKFEELLADDHVHGQPPLCRDL